MPEDFYDALIIGGGPGGSAAATYLSRAGKRVLLLEKEHFPRFHVGESLLPYNHEIFKEMGVLETLQSAGFMPKFGAQFHLGNATKKVQLVFHNGRFTRSPEAFQVERSTFDHLLLKHARASGADVREGWTVKSFSNDATQATIEARDENGQTYTFRGAFLIDASGRSNLTGNQEKLRVIHPYLKKIAIFGHFEGVITDEGTKAGDIHIVRLEQSWFWLIPLSPTKVSVGCVLDQETFSQAKLSPIEIFNRERFSSTEMRARMNNAKLVSAMHTTSDFSYYNRRLVGPRLIRIGDAAGFMDPIFSAGVYLAMFSGKLASELIVASLAAGDNGERRLRKYEKRIFRAMELYWELVEQYYTKPFMELFLQPRPLLSLPDAIVAILAGELEGGWKLDWRRRLFFWLVKAQARWPVAQRLSFTEKEASVT